MDTFKPCIYDTMIDQNECWLVYDSGAAMIVGTINQAVAMEC